MTDPVPSNLEQSTPAGGDPLPKQRRKYARKTKAPVLSTNPPAPRVPPLPAESPIGLAQAATPALAPVVSKPVRRTRQPKTVKVVLTGNFKGFHAFQPTIKFIPGISVTVPNDGWIKAQLKANYLKKV